MNDLPCTSNSLTTRTHFPTHWAEDKTNHCQQMFIRFSDKMSCTPSQRPPRSCQVCWILECVHSWVNDTALYLMLHTVSCFHSAQQLCRLNLQFAQKHGKFRFFWMTGESLGSCNLSIFKLLSADILVLSRNYGLHKRPGQKTPKNLLLHVGGCTKDFSLVARRLTPRIAVSILCFSASLHSQFEHDLEKLNPGHPTTNNLFCNIYRLRSKTLVTLQLCDCPQFAQCAISVSICSNEFRVHSISHQNSSAHPTASGLVFRDCSSVRSDNLDDISAFLWTRFLVETTEGLCNFSFQYQLQPQNQTEKMNFLAFLETHGDSEQNLGFKEESLTTLHSSGLSAFCEQSFTEVTQLHQVAVHQQRPIPSSSPWSGRLSLASQFGGGVDSRFLQINGD